MTWIQPGKAWQRLLPHLAPLPAERLSRREAAGRVLAQALAATVDVPASDVSAMDGFALAGPVEPGESRPVTGTVAAGDPPGSELAPGAAARIMTGAPVPAGADRVLPVEETTVETGDGEARVTLQADPGPGRHIRRRGEVLEAGDPLLPAGSLLTPGALSLVATHGHGTVGVHRAPRVKIQPTGDEVVPPEVVPGPGQLRDSHTDFLLAAGRSLGLAFEPLPVAPDDPDRLARAIEAGVDGDVLLLCGGVSKGEFDFAEDVLADLGYRLLFDAVAVQPGKPLVAAVSEEPGRALVFGLPGNPASVMVCFWLFVRPALRRLLGYPDDYWHGALAATLAGPTPGAKARDRFLPASLAFVDGEIHATPHLTKGSHDVAAYGSGTALLRVPARAGPGEAGEPCEVLPLVDWRGMA